MDRERETWSARTRRFLGRVLADALGAILAATAVAMSPVLLGHLDPVHLVAGTVGVFALGVLISGKGRRVVGSAVARIRRFLGRRRIRATATAPAPAGIDRDDIWLLRRFTTDAAGFTVRVRDRPPLRADELMRARFRELNTVREARGLVPYYDAARFLPLGPPRWVPAEHRFVVDAIEIDYAMAALIIDPDAADDGRSAALARLQRLTGAMSYLPRHWATGRLGLLGVQLCLVTADHRLLLRRRGTSVLFASGRWDVSVSGFAGSADLVGRADVDVTRTVENETYREIGHLRADPRAIRLLGVTHNRVTGAYDVLACWRLDAGVDDLLGLLVRRQVAGSRVFDTEIRAIERYVWDSQNLVVKLDRHAIATALRECGVTADDFEPQSLLCVDLTLDLLVGPGEPRFLPEPLARY